MSKFNRASTRPAVSSPVKTAAAPTTVTGEGGPGYERDAKGELFTLAIANFVSEDSFYEKARNRDDRYTQLVHQCALEDPLWTARFLEWLRGDANMRSASLVGAAEYVKARLDAAGTRERRTHEAGQGKDAATWDGDDLSYRITTNRRVIDSVLQRADEPGELLAYWTAKYGRAIPKPVKRGIGDAILRLGTEFNYVKWGSSEARGFTFADILNLTHPGDRKGSSQSNRFQGPWQHDLFGYVVKRPHQGDTPIPASLATLSRRDALLGMPIDERRHVLEDPELLRRAGITWEALAGWLQGPMDAAAWEAVIPSMGLMALVRNLRNFDEAGVSDQAAAKVAERLADAEQVRRSRMFPFRFLSAYRAAPSLRWAWPLEQALNHSLANVPALPGRTLVLVDRSPSMWMQTFSERSSMPWADAAAVFGAAIALRAGDADLVEFGIENGPVHFRRGESVLKIVERFRRLNGTDIPAAVAAHLAGHDRVVIVTDEQTRPGWLPSNGQHYGGGPARPIDDLIPQGTPLYMWNFGGYKAGAAPSGDGNRHTLGGLSDAAFRLIPLLEARRDAGWPWE
jgi:hypothetical protein